jgi:outer membrane lipoprotein-sorting protein
MKRALFASLAFLLIAASFADAASATSDIVPLPRLRPPYMGADTRTSTPADPSAAVAKPASTFVLNPRSRFSRDQQMQLAAINDYFNSFRVMEGQFIQFGPSGEQSEGVFFMTRPGRIRFHYSPPSRLDVVADGSSVAIRDGKTRTQDLYPLSATPLRYLLSDKIDLTSDNIVQSIREEPDLISLNIVESGGLAQGKLTLIFDRKSYELRQWVVTDAQGLNTSVAIYNTKTGKPQNPNLFRITPGNTF